MFKSQRARLLPENLEERLVMTTAVDLTPVEFRTIDGTNNNLVNPTQGAAETTQIRFGYGDRYPDNPDGTEGFGDYIITEPQRTNPRTISNTIHAQAESIPDPRYLTDWVFQWGQFITHDIDLTRTGAEFNVRSTGEVGDFSIPILDLDDPLGPNPIPFNRSEYADGTGIPGERRETVNAITSYIDASNVYGSDSVRAAALRTFEGGRLKLSAGNLLPFNEDGLPNDDAFGAGAELFLAGDVRANEQIGLTVTHTLFHREHNRLADRIADLYPDLNDEEIYQFARRLVGAQMQIVTYEEYLPSILGYDFAPDPDIASYDPTVDATITNAFAHAAFRFGHSQISETTLLVNNLNTTLGELSIRDAFFNPDILTEAPWNVGLILKGLASQVAQANDVYLVDGVRNNLFGPPGAGGLDLAALDIQRARDHGLPDYNNLRGNYGVPEVTSFDQITSNVEIQQKLEELFGNVDNIDAFTGMLAEDPIPGTSVGPTLHAVIGNQFERLRDGDRFFYTQDAFLQSPEAQAVLDLEEVTLANIIRWNTGIFNIQDNVFFDRSVLIVEAPDAGANVSILAGENAVSVIDTNTGEMLALRSLANTSQVIFVGSNTAADVVNVLIADANGGLEGGVVAYGGGSAGDVLNIYGRLFQQDTFTVSGQTLEAPRTATNDTDIIVERSVELREVDVNGNDIYGTGFETLRIVTLFGGDDVVDPDEYAQVVAWWSLQSEE